jgi:A/G-specific adenine glycosylase
VQPQCRANGAEDASPGQRPGDVSEYMFRPEWAEDSCALAGRTNLFRNPGRCPGLACSCAFSAEIRLPTCVLVRDSLGKSRCATMRIVTIVALSVTETRKFRRRLLAWFSARKRDLPWRRTKDPYRIWLSEIMLQQTRVAAVVPHFESFLARFPDMQALARARNEAVLSHWAGLGYYSRARNLLRAAQEIDARHGGRFPSEYDAALALPGIGHYTAAAVLSIAYGKPLAVLDGNVARVLARLGALRGELRAPAIWRKLEATAQELLAPKTPGDWNQAMMELGATVCTPKSPKCGECPLANWCRARKLGIADKLPDARKKRAQVRITLAAAVLLDPRGRTLLVRRAGGDGALFSRMWQFPALETSADASSELARHLREKFGVKIADKQMTQLKTARHAVTFRQIRLVPFLIRVGLLPKIAGTRTPLLGRFGQLPISSATRKIASAAIAHSKIPLRS